MKRSTLGRAFVLPTTAALVFGLVACGSANEEKAANGPTINGAGASSQEAAQNAWRTGFLNNKAGMINYDPVGSSGGREQFTNGGVDFAGSDAYLDDKEVKAAQERCGKGGFVEVPAYISPIALITNIEGVDSIKLKPATIAKIFNQKITKWNDPEIAAANKGVNLPDTRIVPVNRADGSGTTENFVEYLEQAAPQQWPHEVSDEWPVKGGEAAQGTSGVVQAVKNGNGTIGYVDASQAGDLTTVEVGVGDKFVGYSPEAAASVLDVSKRVEGRGKHSFAFDLARDTTKAGTYPIVLVSYVLACTNYDDADKASMVKDYLNYTVSAEGQKAAEKQAGSAPISDNLRSKIQPAVEAIGSSNSGS